jgi:hypothetical protein
MNFYQSLQSNTAVPTRLDGRGFSYPILAKETPSNPGRLKRSSMQDIAEPVIPGPSKHREPLVEIAPYHIEAHEDNASDTIERSSQQAVPHSLLEHSDLEADASVASQSGIGAVAANTTKDVHAFMNASNSSASTGDEWRRGGGGDDGGESGDDNHEREREREREWEDELARRARVPR